MPTRTRAFLDHLIRHAALAKDSLLPGGQP